MKQVVVLDSSYILALFRQEDTNHAIAKSVADFLQTDTTVLYLNDIIYAEICTVLANKNIQGLVSMLDTWLSIYEVVHIAFDTTYIQNRRNFGERISVQDVSLLVDAKHYGAKILTFDQQVLQLEKTFTL